MDFACSQVEDYCCASTRRGSHTAAANELYSLPLQVMIPQSIFPAKPILHHKKYKSQRQSEIKPDKKNVMGLFSGYLIVGTIYLAW